MNNPGFSIQWVPVDNATGVERIITTDQIITMNDDDEDDPTNSSSTSNHNFLEISSIPNNLDQIAAENLIFMAQDGQVLDGQIVANLVDDLIEEDENDVLDGDQNSKRSLNSSENEMQNQQYFECQVTEEIITDDWAQQGQGEDRLEIPVEQIVVDQSVEDIDVPLPTDQDEYTALRPYPCDFCSRRFRKKSSLLAHMINHQNDRPHICNLCGARFVRRTELLNHLKSHANEEQQFLQRQQQQQFEEIDENYKYLNTSGTGDHYYEHDWQESFEPSPTPKKPKSKSIRNPVGRPRKHPVKIKDEKMDDEFNPSEVSIQNNASHFEITDPRKPFVCQECGVAFAREKALLAHSKIHGNDSPFECNSCNEMFWDLNALTEHHRSHHFEASNSEYEPTEDSDNSDENESKYGEYYCNLCGMSFHRQDLLKRHTKQHLKKELVDESTAAILNTTGHHCCNVCGENFDEALDLLAHAEIHARVQSNKCLLCGESFLEEATIKKHLTGVHANEMTPNSCILCGKHCRDRKALIKHSWDHSHEKSHSCSSCGKTFHNKARLKRHMVSHRSKAVTCEVCHEEFPDGRTLMNHRHSHSNAGGKMFPCHECGKSFGSRSSQQIHVRIHTGERPYGCRFCWKAFADGGTLRKHERIHTGEKPYACSVCPRAFNQRVVLREHIRSHHSSIDSKRGTYYCSVCSEELPSSSELIQHLIQHSDMNTQLQRQPVVNENTAPRKYKRRRKLKPHELERLKTERANTSDVDMSDEFTDNIAEDLFIEKATTTAKSKAKKSNNAKTTRNVKSERLNNKKSDSSALSNHWETKLITNSSPNESYNLGENTLQSIQPLIMNTSGSSTTKATKRSGRGGPKMIHTQKTRVSIEDSSSKRKTKTVITRAETANLSQQRKHSVQEIPQELHDLPSQSLQLPLFGRRKRDFSTSDFDSVLPDEITSSPQKISETKPDIYVDAQLLLETSAIRKELDKYNYNSNIVSDLEDILRSPDRQLTYDSETNNQLSSPEKRSTRRSVPNRKYLEFDTTAGQKLAQKEKFSTPRYSTRNKRKNQEEELILPDIFNKSSDIDIKIESDSSDDEERINIKNEDIDESDDILLDDLSNIKKSKPDFQCEMCSEIFIDRAQLLGHVNIHI